MKNLILILGLILSILSCKKDKLIGDKAILVGRWEWTHTGHVYGICKGDYFTETLTPESEGHNFTMEFFEKGKVKFYQNDELLATDRITLIVRPAPCSGDLPDHLSIYIRLNNKDNYEFRFFGCVDTNEIIFSKGFPFNLTDESETGCEFYTSYFIKE